MPVVRKLVAMKYSIIIVIAVLFAVVVSNQEAHDDSCAAKFAVICRIIHNILSKKRFVKSVPGILRVFGCFISAFLWILFKSLSN